MVQFLRSGSLGVGLGLFVAVSAAHGQAQPQTAATPTRTRAHVDALASPKLEGRLTGTPGADVAAYKRALLERYANPALRHRTWQIAMDGSQKLPQRLLGSIRDRLAAGLSIDRLMMGVAGWMRYVTGLDEQGKPIDVRDPLSARLRAIADEAGLNAERLAPALLGVREIFGELADDPRFRATVQTALAGIIAKGAKQAVAGA